MLEAVKRFGEAILTQVVKAECVRKWRVALKGVRY
jgi:hypothetical protein